MSEPDLDAQPLARDPADQPDERRPAADMVVPPEGAGDPEDGAVGSVEPPD